MIISNYQSILDEMQITLATETLSRCIRNEQFAAKNILPQNGKRKDRMNSFLKFVLQEDDNVIAFASVLKKYGLEELLQHQLQQKSTEDHQTIDDIGISKSV